MNIRQIMRSAMISILPYVNAEEALEAKGIVPMMQHIHLERQVKFLGQEREEMEKDDWAFQ